MKTKLFFIGLISLFFLTNCNDQKDPIISENNDDFEKNNFVSEEVAKLVAQNFFSGLHTESNLLKSELKYNKDQKIKEILSINNHNSDASLMYIVNYEKDGYLIISADNRVEPILAYSDIGSFNLENDLPLGLKNWLELVKDNIYTIRENNETQSDILKKEWDKVSSGLSTKSTSIPRKVVGPLLNTLWHQEETFNDKMPALSCGPNGKAYVGCVPIAAAQILKYHQYPTNYQWNQMPNTEGSFYTQSLMYGIHNFISFDEKINYRCDGTAINSNYDLSILFKRYFGYRTANASNYDSDVVVNNIAERKPVILRAISTSGVGHAWVCDGYDRYYDEVGSTTYMYTYLHMNWGWVSGDYNGWYSYNRFTSANENFSQNQRMVYNIKP